jgi:GNAT superfamily N-acetyltransferase
VDFTIRRGYLPGCIGRIVELHARYYHQNAGFGVRFEAKVARELAEFCERYAQERDGLWMALDSRGHVHGSIAIDGLHSAHQGAHLRWFITSDEIRGSGAGKALLAAAVDFCRSCEYRRVYLWSFEGLGAARHLYERFGFRLAHQQRGIQWGTEVDEQRFELRES